MGWIDAKRIFSNHTLPSTCKNDTAEIGAQRTYLHWGEWFEH